MPFVTNLRLQSGDRRTLEDVVTDIKTDAERKGVELKGPHPKPPEHRRVPLYKRVGSVDSFDTWDYTVYTRTIEIVGHEEFAREVTGRSFPDSVYVAVEVESVRQTGSGPA